METINFKDVSCKYAYGANETTMPTLKSINLEITRWKNDSY